MIVGTFRSDDDPDRELRERLARHRDLMDRLEGTGPPPAAPADLDLEAHVVAQADGAEEAFYFHGPPRAGVDPNALDLGEELDAYTLEALFAASLEWSRSRRAAPNTRERLETAIALLVGALLITALFAAATAEHPPTF